MHLGSNNEHSHQICMDKTNGILAESEKLLHNKDY